MKVKITAISLAAFVCSSGVLAAQSSKAPAAKREAYYVDPALKVSVILAAPPAADSQQTLDDLAEDHRIEKTRTASQVAAAQADDKEEDIFIYRTVMGADFNAEKLPLTAALSKHVRVDEGYVGSQLKAIYKRPRPYQADKTLHPVCAVTTEPNSYPSGHSLSGYLLAFTLAELVPEKRDAILMRADDYAHNRIVCGVHYRGDTEASRRTAYVAFGSMLSNPRFQTDLAAAREELKSAHLAQ